jgi:hypothetical protein
MSYRTTLYQLDRGPSYLNLTLITSDSGISQVGKHRWRVIAPDKQLFNRCDWLISLFCELPSGSIVIKPSHSAEIFTGNALGMGRCNKGIGVGGITDDQDFDVSVCMLSKCLTLLNENFSVFHQQVCSLHSL